MILSFLDRARSGCCESALDSMHYLPGPNLISKSEKPRVSPTTLVVWTIDLLSCYLQIPVVGITHVIQPGWVTFQVVSSLLET